MNKQRYNVMLCSVDPSRFPLEDLVLGSIAAQLSENGITNSVYYYRTNMADEVEESCANIVLFNVFSFNYRQVNEIINYMKTQNPQVITVVTGQFVLNNRSLFKFMPGIDYAIVGEGDETAVELFLYLCNGQDKLLSEIKGIAFRQNNMIVNNPPRALIDPSSLHWADRSLLRSGECQEAMIEASRGCTGTCSFCVLRSSKWRPRNIKDVIDEMQYIKECYGIDVFSFTDPSFDNPNMNIPRITHFCDEIILRKLNAKLMIYLKAQIYKNEDVAFWEKLTSAGLSSVLIGIESFDENDILLYGKKANSHDNVLCVSKLMKMDFQLLLGFINFNPYSSYDSLKNNNNMLHTLGFAYRLYQLNFLRMLPGTPISKRAAEDGLFVDNGFNFCDYHFKDEGVEKLAIFLKKDLISNSYMQPVIKAIKDLSRLEKFLYIIKRDAEFRNDEKMLNTIQAGLHERNLLCSELNSIIYNYFDSCIEKIFNHASQQCIEKGNESLFDLFFHDNIIAMIEKIRLTTIMNCMRINTPNTRRFLKIRQL